MKIIKLLIYILLIWTFLFFAIEFVCGFFAGNKYFKADLIDYESADTSYGYFKPSQHRKILFPGHQPYVLTINDLGLRSTGAKKDWTNYDQRILSIGDSFTFGLFIDDENSYPFLLQQEVEQDNTIVFNAGIGSTGIKDHWYYLKERGIDLQPNVVIMNFYGNDLGDIKAEMPYYEKVKQDEPEKWWVKSNFFRSILGIYVNFKYQRWLSKINDQRVYEILHSKSQTLNDSLYASWNYHTWRSIKDPYSDEIAEQWREHLGYLKLIHEYLQERGIQFIYVINPELVSIFDKPESRHEDILINFMEVHNIDYINLIDVFKTHKENILTFYNDPPRDFHLNAKGNRIVVTEILKKLRQNQ